MKGKKAICVLLLLAAIAILPGCGKKVRSAMGSGSIVALIRTDANAEAADALAEFLGRDRYLVPRPEKPFKITQMTIAGLDSHRYDKNIVLLCDVSEKGELLKTVRNILSEEDRRQLGRGESRAISLSDSWGKFQNVVVIAAPSSEKLLRLVEDEGAAIVDRLEEDVIGVMVRMFAERTVVPGLGSRAVSRDGWSLQLPEGYRMKAEKEDVPLLHFEAAAPPRIVFVHWYEGTPEMTVDDLIEFRSRFGWDQYDEDEIAEGRVRGQVTTLAGNPAVRIEGLWQNAKYTIGGPFITYLVLCPDGKQTILLDLIVYAPGMDQVRYLRELEAVARTLKCSAGT
ncbi:MAG: DUF4837 family protein [Candidatus Eisenbacteria sp.]|nr:DUF4837 family protein [Candidatus Eisenbacteria bacterium]